MYLKRFANVLAEIRFLCAYTEDCSECEFNYIDEDGVVGCFCQGHVFPDQWALGTIIERAKAQKEERKQ